MFLSYRVDSDEDHAAAIYEALTREGISVWWDKKCLRAGEPWEDGFCRGLIKSRVFLPLFSRGAIRDPTAPHRNFECLAADSPCDNVLLENRLALELRDRGLIDKIYPLFIGDKEEISPTNADHTDTDTDTYINYIKYEFRGPNASHPQCPNVSVATVEGKVHEHLEKQGLGLPYSDSPTVAGILKEITKYQGGFIEGAFTDAVTVIVNSLKDIVKEFHPHSIPKPQYRLRTQTVDTHSLSHRPFPGFSGSFQRGNVGSSSQQRMNRLLDFSLTPSKDSFGNLPVSKKSSIEFSSDDVAAEGFDSDSFSVAVSAPSAGAAAGSGRSSASGMSFSSRRPSPLLKSASIGSLYFSTSSSPTGTHGLTQAQTHVQVLDPLEEHEEHEEHGVERDTPRDEQTYM